MNFSASRIKTWMACALQAHFKYDEHLPQRQSGKQTFGVIIHHCLDLYNQTGNIELAIETFKHYWLNPQDMGIEPEWWPKFTSYNGLRARGIELLEHFHEQTKWDTREVIATEHRFKVHLGEHTLNGVVDLLEVRKSGKGKNLLRVVDYKTAGRKPSKAQLFLDVQFTSYVYASLQPEFWLGFEDDPDYPPILNGEWWMNMLADTPRRPIWFHLMGPTEIDAGDRGENDFKQLYRVCEEIRKADEAQIWVPHIGDSCNLCDFVDACGLEIPSPEQVREQDNAWI